VACRLRWGTERAKFKFPGSRFGLVLGSRRLAHCVGAARSITILANNETVLAEQALSDGLLTEIMSDTDAMKSRIAELANNLQGLSQTTLQALLEETNVASQNDLALKALKNSMTAGLKDRIQTFRNSNSQSK
jgi:enoyl-CoA hydratase/carnithine racemase